MVSFPCEWVHVPRVGDRHVLDAVPVALQVWALRGGLKRTWANEEARRQVALPSDDEALAAACAEQEPAVLEWEGRDHWWRVQITPLGARSILVAFADITAQKAHEHSLRASEQLNREILCGPAGGRGRGRHGRARRGGQRGRGRAVRRVRERALGDHAECHPRRPARRPRAPAGRGPAAADAGAQGRGGARAGRALRAPGRLAAVGGGARQPALRRQRRPVRRGRLLRRRDRARGAGPAHAPRGRHRRADGAREPARARADAGGGAGPGGHALALGRRGDARPRRLQGHQRHARTRGRGRGVARGGRAGCGAASASATSWPGSAATSSCSC